MDWLTEYSRCIGLFILRSDVTTTALTELATYISHVLNHNTPCKRTIEAALDLTKGFDTVAHPIFLRDTLNSTLSDSITRFLSFSIQGMKRFVEFRNVTLRLHKIKKRYSAGESSFFIMFNFYI